MSKYDDIANEIDDDRLGPVLGPFDPRSVQGMANLMKVAAILGVVAAVAIPVFFL